MQYEIFNKTFVNILDEALEGKKQPSKNIKKICFNKNKLGMISLL
mgnify:CR=1 FL=1